MGPGPGRLAGVAAACSAAALVATVAAALVQAGDLAPVLALGGAVAAVPTGWGLLSGRTDALAGGLAGMATLVAVAVTWGAPHPALLLLVTAGLWTATVAAAVSLVARRPAVAGSRRRAATHLVSVSGLGLGAAAVVVALGTSAPGGPAADAVAAAALLALVAALAGRDRTGPEGPVL